jgi:hypothetical protein
MTARGEFARKGTHRIEMAEKGRGDEGEVGQDGAAICPPGLDRIACGRYPVP